MAKQKTGKDALLWWCQEMTKGYANVLVQNFHTSWGDGLAFCAIIHRFHPEKIPFETLSKDQAAKNLTLAFTVAEKLGIPQLLDVDDMLIPKPEQFSVMTYLSQYFHHFQNKVQGNPGLGLATITSGGSSPTFTSSGPPLVPKKHEHSNDEAVCAALDLAHPLPRTPMEVDSREQLQQRALKERQEKERRDKAEQEREAKARAEFARLQKEKEEVLRRQQQEQQLKDAVERERKEQAARAEQQRREAQQEQERREREAQAAAQREKQRLEREKREQDAARKNKLSKDAAAAQSAVSPTTEKKLEFQERLRQLKEKRSAPALSTPAATAPSASATPPTPTAVQPAPTPVLAAAEPMVVTLEPTINLSSRYTIASAPSSLVSELVPSTLSRQSAASSQSAEKPSAVLAPPTSTSPSGISIASPVIFSQTFVTLPVAASSSSGSGSPPSPKPAVPSSPKPTSTYKLAQSSYMPAPLLPTPASPPAQPAASPLPTSALPSSSPGAPTLSSPRGHSQSVYRAPSSYVPSPSPTPPSPRNKPIQSLYKPAATSSHVLEQKPAAEPPCTAAPEASKPAVASVSPRSKVPALGSLSTLSRQSSYTPAEAATTPATSTLDRQTYAAPVPAVPTRPSYVGQAAQPADLAPALASTHISEPQAAAASRSRPTLKAAATMPHLPARPAYAPSAYVPSDELMLPKTPRDRKNELEEIQRKHDEERRRQEEDRQRKKEAEEKRLREQEERRKEEERKRESLRKQQETERMELLRLQAEMEAEKAFLKWDAEQRALEEKKRREEESAATATGAVASSASPAAAAPQQQQRPQKELPAPPVSPGREKVFFSPQHKSMAVASGAVPAPAEPTELLEGYLQKQDPGGFKLWRQRWFSLLRSGAQLMYWETSDISNPNNPPLGTIPLASVIRILPERNSTKNVFLIETAERVYALQAASKVEMDHWVAQLLSAMSSLVSKGVASAQQQQSPALVNNFTTKEGFLFKQGGLLTGYSWSKYWFTLKHGFLSWSKKQGAAYEGRIPLYRARFENYVNPSRPLGVRVVTQAADTFMISADNEEELAEWINAILKQKIAIEETIEMISF